MQPVIPMCPRYRSINDDAVEPKPPSWPPDEDAFEAKPTTKPLDDPQASILLKKPPDKVYVPCGIQREEVSCSSKFPCAEHLKAIKKIHGGRGHFGNKKQIK